MFTSPLSNSSHHWRPAVWPRTSLIDSLSRVVCSIIHGVCGTATTVESTERWRVLRRSGIRVKQREVDEIRKTILVNGKKIQAPGAKAHLKLGENAWWSRRRSQDCEQPHLASATASQAVRARDRARACTNSRVLART